MLSKLLSVSVISLGLATGAMAQTAVTPNDQTMTNTTNGAGTGTYGSNNATQGTVVDPGMTYSTNRDSGNKPAGQLTTQDSPCAAPAATPTEGSSTSPVNRTQC